MDKCRRLDFVQMGLMLISSIFAGFVGALFGIGGGVIIVPTLTAFLGLGIKDAIATSIVGVVATSIAGASRYLKQGITNVKLALFLETSATLGAMSGAMLEMVSPSSILFMILAALLLFMALNQVKTFREEERRIRSGGFKGKGDRISNGLRLSGSYHDAADRVRVEYTPTRSKLGIAMSYFAGLFSGLLGIGGGVLKVPIMNQFMDVPMKVSVGTSKFMIGITASTAALVYFSFGLVKPELASPVVLGVVMGATLGAMVMNRIKAGYLKLAFASLLVYFSYLMATKGLSLMVGA